MTKERELEYKEVTKMIEALVDLDMDCIYCCKGKLKFEKSIYGYSHSTHDCLYMWYLKCNWCSFRTPMYISQKGRTIKFLGDSRERMAKTIEIASPR